MGDAHGCTVPAGTYRIEQVIDRSRFIATVGRARTDEEARAFMDSVRSAFPDATHNCWAYVAGPAGSTAAIGMSDAGEPHGTAGRPMLDVLLHSGVGEVAAVVTRYYGGVKLGRGGLVRAYGGAVQEALRSMPRQERVDRVTLTASVGYEDVDVLRRLLAEHGAEILDESYGAAVAYRIAVPARALTTFEAVLGDRTAGRAQLARE